jgi:hypothetical protein
MTQNSLLDVRLVRLAVLFVLVTCTGCGSGTYPVKGKLLWQDGSPAAELAGGMVVFEHREAALGARGEIQSDGGFELTTYKPGDGAPRGPYRVLLSEPAREDTDAVPPPRADLKYRSPDTSGLEFTVQAGANEAVFKLDRASPQAKRGQSKSKR